MLPSGMAISMMSPHAEDPRKSFALRLKFWFITHLRGMLSRHPGAQPQDLELEILETSAVEDFVQVSQLMALCERMRLRFALDDFGSG